MLTSWVLRCLLIFLDLFNLQFFIIGVDSYLSCLCFGGHLHFSGCLQFWLELQHFLLLSSFWVYLHFLMSYRLFRLSSFFSFFAFFSLSWFVKSSFQVQFRVWIFLLWQIYFRKILQIKLGKGQTSLIALN